jgi:hypothetical protein
VDWGCLATHVVQNAATRQMPAINAGTADIPVA